MEIIYQHDSMQCGIACLQMVCKYFGRGYTMESLSKLCLAYTLGAVDAYHQQNGNRLYTQMVVASHFLTYQHIIGK